MYTFGTFAYITAIAIFVYFTVINYENSVNQAFISIDFSSGTCNSVPIAVSGTFLADDKGNWVGTPDFVYSSAIYSLSLNNFQVQSQQQYVDMMDTFNDTLYNISTISKNQDLTSNLIIWMAFQRYYSVNDPNNILGYTKAGSGQLQSLQMTGLPTQVFNLNYEQGTIGSARGYCNIATSGTYFDQANAELFITYPHDSYAKSTICEAASPATSLGYVQTFDENVFSIKVDVRSFVTAVAVNLKLLALDNLAISNTKIQNFTTANTTFELGQYYDIRYPEMDPILCVRNTTQFDEAALQELYKRYQNGASMSNITIPFSTLCFYGVGNTVTLPIFNHFGTSKSVPKRCYCGIYNHESCNQFDFLTTLLFYPVARSSSSTNLQIVSQVVNLVDLVIKWQGFRAVNDLAFNASWAGGARAYKDMAPYVNTTSWVAEQFKFCGSQVSKVAGCSMIVFNSFNPTDQLVSEYKYQLVNGSCRNTFTIPNEYW